MDRVITNRILLVLALAGAGVSAYLVLAHLNAVNLVCGGASGCEEVANSRWARGFGIAALEGIPTAAFGLAAFLALVVLSFVRAASPGTGAALAAGRFQWLLAAGGLAVAAWLTYLEAYVIHAWCWWCVASAVIILLIFLVSTADRLARPPARGELSEAIRRD